MGPSLKSCLILEATLWYLWI